MKLMRSPSLFLAALALVGLVGSEAAAQPPTVTFSQAGNAVTINWTAVPGATTYEVFVAGVPNSPFTTPSTSVVVNPAPAGTYVIQVRGRNGNQVGDLSAPTTIVVGGTGTIPGCGAIGAPTVTVSTAGMTVNVAWTPVAGAIGYRLQVGTAPGATQFQQDFGAGQTGFGAPIPFIGTFYLRVIAANACGALAPSGEQSFTVGAATPGPAPGPTPGSGLPFPIPAACAAGDGYGCASAMAPLSTEWGLCRSGNGVGCQRFTRQVVYALSRTDPNWKMIRAAPGGHACSCSSCGPSDGNMFREDTTVYGGNRVFDLIIGAGGPSPSLWWNEVPGPRAGDLPADAPVCR
jgi:hypothetical protein